MVWATVCACSQPSCRYGLCDSIDFRSFPINTDFIFKATHFDLCRKAAALLKPGQLKSLEPASGSGTSLPRTGRPMESLMPREIYASLLTSSAWSWLILSSDRAIRSLQFPPWFHATSLTSLLLGQAVLRGSFRRIYVLSHRQECFSLLSLPLYHINMS